MWPDYNIHTRFGGGSAWETIDCKELGTMAALVKGGLRRRIGRGPLWPAGAIAMAIAMVLSPVGAMALVTPVVERAPVLEERPGMLLGELLSDIDGFFTENLGQLDESIKYYCIGNPISIAFGTSCIMYDVGSDDNEIGVMFRVTFAGANRVNPVGIMEATHRCNFFLGDDPLRWMTGAHNYKEVIYKELYDDVDLRFSLDGEGLKYGFVVRPGADPSTIKMDFEGIAGLEIGGADELIIKTLVGNIRDRAPVSFQEETLVPTSFHVYGPTEVGFSLSDYDPGSPILIDPGINFSTYLGGASNELGVKACLDGEHNIIVMCDTNSTDFPVTIGAYQMQTAGKRDIVVTKVDANCSSVLFSTYLGGSNDDASQGIVLTSTGQILLTGSTKSTDFPVTDGVVQDRSKSGPTYDDVFIAQLDASGDLLRFSTYLGGSSSDIPRDILVDSNDDIYVGGRVTSNDFPTVSGSYDTSANNGMDVFITKMNANATKLMYSSYLGGSDSDFGILQAVDPEGCAILAGGTWSTDFPTTFGAYDTTSNGGMEGFVTKMNPQGTSLVFSTYLGGSGGDVIETNIVIDENGSLIGGGNTGSSNLPITSGAYDSSLSVAQDGFLFMLDSTGKNLLYCSYFGGDGSDCFESLALPPNGPLYFSGTTSSTDLPTTQDAAFEDPVGKNDYFIGLLDINSTDLDFCTYLGGSEVEQGYSSHVLPDTTGLYFVGGSNSTDYPTTTGAYDVSANGGNDIVITKLDEGPSFNGTPPSPPVNLTVTAGIRQLSLAWDPPLSTGGMNVKGYRIFRGNDEQNLYQLGAVGPQERTYLDGPLVTGVRFYYAVSAFNYYGQGNLSTIVSNITYGRPRSPLDISATAGCENATVRWTPPFDTGGLPILGYKLYRGLATTSMVLLRDLGEVQEFLDEGLENGRSYLYQVHAVNAMGDGDNSTLISATPRGPPSSPQYFSVTARSGDVAVACPPAQWWRPDCGIQRPQRTDPAGPIGPRYGRLVGRHL
jgi:hypothetical protein